MFDNIYKKLSFSTFTAGIVFAAASVAVSVFNLKTLFNLNTLFSILFWVFTLLGIVFLFFAKNKSGGGMFKFFTSAKIIDILLLAAVIIYLISNILKLYFISGFMFIVFIYLFELHCLKSLNWE